MRSPPVKSQCYLTLRSCCTPHKHQHAGSQNTATPKWLVRTNAGALRSFLLLEEQDGYNYQGKFHPSQFFRNIFLHLSFCRDLEPKLTRQECVPQDWLPVIQMRQQEAESSRSFFFLPNNPISLNNLPTNCCSSVCLELLVNLRLFSMPRYINRHART